MCTAPFVPVSSYKEVKTQNFLANEYPEVCLPYVKQIGIY